MDRYGKALRTNRRTLSILLLSSPLIVSARTTPPGSDWPSRPITLVVPYTPGGSTDIVARLIADKLGKLVGQAVVVENKPGAGGNIGTGYAAHQPPDGYTLVMGNIGPIAASPALYSNLPYDPQRDLRPVRNIIGIPNAVLVPATSAFKTIQDLLANKGKEPISCATPGPASSAHLTAERFSIETGVRLQQVHYKGSAHALNDLIAGHVSLMFDNLPASIGHVNAGRIRALAVTTAERLAQLPDVPTLQEAGLRDFSVSGWAGVFVPAGTPDVIVAQLYRFLEQIMQDPEIRSRITALSAQIPEGDPDRFRGFVADEITRWHHVIKTSGIRVE